MVMVHRLHGATLSSFAPTQADGRPGDLDDLDDYQDFVYKSKWNETECTDGFWTPATRGGGAGWDASEGWPGTWGMHSANWVGHWKEARLHRHMNIDLRGLILVK